MSSIFEPDDAWSVVVDASQLDKLRSPDIPPDKPWINRMIDRYWVPDEADRPVELVRGLPPYRAENDVYELTKLGVRASYHRWDQLEEGVIRAPHRIPGYIGKHEAFCVDKGLVLRWGNQFSDDCKPSWQSQSFLNHSHYSEMEYLKNLHHQYEHVETLGQELVSFFPDRRFIIAIEPGSTKTFYEPTEDAPTESDTEWQKYLSVWSEDHIQAIKETFKKVAKGTVSFTDMTSPVCHQCGGLKVVQPYESIRFPGVVEAICDGCGEGYIGAARLMRYKFGAWNQDEVAER